MLSIILAVILGIIFTFVATQNPAITSVNFFNYTLSLPLYVVGALAFLCGIFLTLLLTLFQSTANFFDLQGKENKIRQFEKSNNTLVKENAALRAENQKLQENISKKASDLRAEKVEHTKERVKGFLGRVKHNLTN